jgi:hypothetical protein
MSNFKKIISFLVLVILPFMGYYLYGKIQSGNQEGLKSSASLPSINQGKVSAEVKGAVVEDLHGFMVWSSNRYGNHELLKMTFPDKKIVRLTNNPLADTFPRISPDGKQLIFLRAKKENVSQRDYLQWDIYLLDLSSSQEKFLVGGGYLPSWSEKGDFIYYQKGTAIDKYELATGKVSVVFEAGKTVHVPADASLGMPSWSSKKQGMAITFREGLRATGVIKPGGDVILIGDGCQITWSPDGTWLYYVDHDWKRNNIFYRTDLETKKSVLFFDSPTEYSHEYFPKLDHNGKYMVYGASTGGHEHDQADYEIFLWRLGSPYDSAVRLTFDPANDCWPDIYLN